MLSNGGEPPTLGSPMGVCTPHTVAAKAEPYRALRQIASKRP